MDAQTLISVAIWMLKTVGDESLNPVIQDLQKRLDAVEAVRKQEIEQVKSQFERLTKQVRLDVKGWP